MAMVSESAEMMLKHIHSLSAAGDRVRTTDLAQQTGLTPATVTEMVQRLNLCKWLLNMKQKGKLIF